MLTLKQDIHYINGKNVWSWEKYCPGLAFAVDFISTTFLDYDTHMRAFMVVTESERVSVGSLPRKL